MSSVLGEVLGVASIDPEGFGLLLPAEEDAVGELAFEEVGCRIPRAPVRGVPSVPPAVISKVGSE